MRHKIVFSRRLNWFSDIVYFLIHVFFRQGSRYQTVSHQTHHRYTMVHGVDPETAFPETISRKWVRKTLGGLLLTVLTLGIPAFLKAMFTLTKRSAGWKDRMMRDHASEKDLKFIQWESIAIVVLNLVMLAGSIWLRRWDLIFILVIGPQVGGAIVAFWWMTEHIGMMYNANDQRFCTRGVKVSPFVKFLYGGLDEHIEHHMFPAVPSRNLTKLREAIDQPIQDRIGVVACWREIYAIAKHQETDSDDVMVPFDR
jgi:fatty acid desaturase